MSPHSPNVFMIGWEYPPHNSGGLGVACEGLTQALAGANAQVYFTLPYHHTQQLPHLNLIDCFNPDWNKAGDRPPFLAYAGAGKPYNLADEQLDADSLQLLPSSELEHRVDEYAGLVAQEAHKLRAEIDVIHAHDWMTYPAAAQIKQELKKPFIAHIHSTEFDRIPTGYGSPYIHHTEYEGLQAADRVIAVSYYTKRLLVQKYAVDPGKIDVVHNGVPAITSPIDPGRHHFAPQRPVVVFMGRLTMQKGADYFIALARQVLEVRPETLFVIAGHGDMYSQLLLSTATQGLSASVLFGGFLRGSQRERLLDRADVFVMPSLSEPFGLVALEAAQRRTPVVISKTSGVAEVLKSAIQVDFWDTDQMSSEILRLINQPNHANSIISSQSSDLLNATWEKAAINVRNVYRKAYLGSSYSKNI